jgi:YbgC/YbaW family acyl-CoA thioester hydrolase
MRRSCTHWRPGRLVNVEAITLCERGTRLVAGVLRREYQACLSSANIVLSDVNTAFLYDRRVQFAETDLAGIVHFSWYFRYMEEAEHALWRAAGLSISPREPAVGWPRVAAAFEYKAPLRFEETFQVAVRINAVSRRTLQYGCTLHREQTLIGNGLLTAACVTADARGSMIAVDLPSGLVERLRAAMTGAVA